MNTALIINAYSARNAGDAAIMLATTKLLAQSGRDNVTVSSRYADEDRSFYEDYGVEICQAIIPFETRGDRGSVLRLLMFAIATSICYSIAIVGMASNRLSLALCRLLRLSGMTQVVQADCVVLAGGGYLYSAKRRLNFTLIHALLQVRLARLMGKRILMMPQSVGPLNNRFDAFLVRVAHKGVRPLVVRDAESVRVATESLGRTLDVELVPDVVFHGLPAYKAPYRQQSVLQSPDVLIIAMDWTWARSTNKEDLNGYISKLARAAETLASKGISVSLGGNSRIPEQNQDDFDIARQVFECIDLAHRQRVKLLDHSTNLESLRLTMTRSKVVIGTRLHSCILALVEGKPTIALAYQPKTIGTYEHLGLLTYCRDVQSFEATELSNATVTILSNLPQEMALVKRAVADASDQIARFYAQDGSSS